MSPLNPQGLQLNKKVDLDKREWMSLFPHQIIVFYTLQLRKACFGKVAGRLGSTFMPLSCQDEKAFVPQNVTFDKL